MFERQFFFFDVSLGFGKKKEVKPIRKAQRQRRINPPFALDRRWHSDQRATNPSLPMCFIYIYI